MCSSDLDYSIWGMDPLGYHLTNILLHGVAAALFYLVARQLLTLAWAAPSARLQQRAVAGFADLLRQRYSGQLDEKADQYINFTIDGAKRMQGLLNGLLDYSRVTMRRNPLAQVNLEDVWLEVVADLGPAITETQAVVTHDPLPAVYIDQMQFKRLLQNLVSNALKFRGPESPRVHVSVRALGEEWEFAVRDNGIGIAPEFVAKIFDIFQRLHTRQQYPGTGLGLAICKRIVERHGGRIWVESTPGQGSTFRFTIRMMPTGDL